MGVIGAATGIPGECMKMLWMLDDAVCPMPFPSMPMERMKIGTGTPQTCLLFAA
ncbi:hypothetical protein D3C83_273660 [compost metagenome]